MRIVETIVVHDQYDTLIHKFQVIERIDGKFISTLWDCEDCLESDRLASEFETESGALCDMYREVIAWTGIRLENGLALSSKVGDS